VKESKITVIYIGGSKEKCVLPQIPFPMDIICISMKIDSRINFLKIILCLYHIKEWMF